MDYRNREEVLIAFENDAYSLEYASAGENLWFSEEIRNDKEVITIAVRKMYGPYKMLQPAEPVRTKGSLNS